MGKRQFTTTTSTPITANHWDASTLFPRIETITDPIQVTKLSQDYHTFSPILQPKLAGKTADLVVCPVNEAEIFQVAAACIKYKIPLTVRGAGTGNYGQSVPLHGGVILDMIPIQEILWVKPG